MEALKTLIDDFNIKLKELNDSNIKIYDNNDCDWHLSEIKYDPDTDRVIFECDYKE